jgi:mRNA interferase HicA
VSYDKTQVSHSVEMPIKPRKLQSLLETAGCSVENKRGGSGHKTAKNGSRKTDIPFHGGGFEIPDGLLNKILRDLGLTRRDIGLE